MFFQGKIFQLLIEFTYLGIKKYKNISSLLKFPVVPVLKLMLPLWLYESDVLLLKELPLAFPNWVLFASLWVLIFSYGVYQFCIAMRLVLHPLHPVCPHFHVAFLILHDVFNFFGLSSRLFFLEGGINKGTFVNQVVKTCQKGKLC